MMTTKEFINVVIPSDILNQRDVEGILLRQSTPWLLWSSLPPSPYIERPRITTNHRWLVVPLYNQVQYSYRRVHCPNAQESLRYELIYMIKIFKYMQNYFLNPYRFLASHDIYLVGIECYGPIYNAPLTSYKIKYQLENQFMSFYYKTPPESVSILTPHDFEVEFPHPIKISGQVPHKLTVCLEVGLNVYKIVWIFK
jgi:hypothetical protein